MVTDIERIEMRDVQAADRVYFPDILPKLQFLLADLADLDLQYRMNVETIRHSPVDEGSRREMIEGLRQHHDECRSPIVQEICALEDRIKAACDG